MTHRIGIDVERCPASDDPNVGAVLMGGIMVKGPRIPSDAQRRPRRGHLRRLEELLPFLRDGRYRIGPHVAKHMLQEGFIEMDVVQAVEWGREVAVYPEDQRMLVLGYMTFPPRLKLPLHVVLEYKESRWVDIVTAFIPKKPHQVYSRARIAAILRYDGSFEEVRWVRPKFLTEDQIPR